MGEVTSGIFYGLLIPFILLYINLPRGNLLSLSISVQSIDIHIGLWSMLSLLLLSVAPICTTANIMLANNICDLKKDIAVKRHTLPYYLGKKALYLFAGLYYAAYAALVAMVILGILPPISLLFLLTIIPVQRNIGLFFRKQDKAATFILSIKNYVIIMGAEVILLFIGRFAMKDSRKFIKKTDLIIIGIIVAVSLAGWAIYNGAMSGKPAKAEIYYKSNLVTTIDLSTGEDKTFSIPQNDHVKFHLYADGGICFEQSDCPDKICIHAGILRHVGQSAACLPNGIILKIVSDDDPSVDIVAGH